MKKGQAALEFLTTYGWAFMVLLVLIGALAYFGVFNPRGLTPNSCQLGVGFQCKEAVFFRTPTGAYGNISFVMSHSMPGSLQTFTIRAIYNGKSAKSIATCTPVNASIVVLAPGRNYNMYCAAFAPVIPTFAAGDKVKFQIELNYSGSEDVFNKTSQGEISLTVY